MPRCAVSRALVLSAHEGHSFQRAAPSQENTLFLTFLKSVKEKVTNLSRSLCAHQGCLPRSACCPEWESQLEPDGSVSLTVELIPLMGTFYS